MKFHEKLKQERKKHNLSQEDLPNKNKAFPMVAEALKFNGLESCIIL